MTLDLFTYPHAAGWKEPTTSRDAAKAIETTGKAATLREQSLAVLKRHAATADEVAGELRQSVLAIRPRLTELSQQGKIERTGERRASSTGTLQHVWRAV